MESRSLNGIITYAPKSRKELIQYAFNHKKIIIAVNAEKIMFASEENRKIVNRNLGYPDGIGAVWALKKKGVKIAIKIPGCELWLDLIKSCYKTKSFYLIGGEQEVIEATVSKLKSEFDGIKICNFKNGYIKTESEKQEIIENVIKHQPDIVFVAMGSPKQEILMENIQKKHQAVYQGLGGSFDVYSGNINRAPKFWINANLEWAYRLFKEPSRIKRQITYIPFLIKLIFNKL